MPPTSSARRGTGTPRNTIASLMQRVVVEADGCWRWAGRITTKGYGQVGWRGRPRQAHVVFYEALVGPVADGMTVDHLCRNRACVNPAHLEPVANRENVLRGDVPSANRSLCKRGVHDITAAGSIYVDSEGCERCRACRAESKRRYAERRRRAA